MEWINAGLHIKGYKVFLFWDLIHILTTNSFRICLKSILKSTNINFKLNVEKLLKAYYSFLYMIYLIIDNIWRQVRLKCTNINVFQYEITNFERLTCQYMSITSKDDNIWSRRGLIKGQFYFSHKMLCTILGQNLLGLETLNIFR